MLDVVLSPDLFRHSMFRRPGAPTVNQCDGDWNEQGAQRQQEDCDAGAPTCGTRWSEVGCRAARRRIVKLADLSTVVIRRRLPLRVEGSQGEAIDYWLDATAIGVDITVGALARAADLPIATLVTLTTSCSLLPATL
jgi:hypothetical protein